MEQKDFLNKIQIWRNIGDIGIEEINDLIVNNPVDLATLALKILEKINELKKGIDRINKIHSAIHDLNIEEKFESENEVIVRVRFTGDASINNIEDSKDWMKKWYIIGEGIARASSCTTHDIKVIGASTGSLILILQTIHEFADTLISIMKLVGLAIGTFKGIQLAKLQVEKMELEKKNKEQILKGYDKEIEQRKVTLIAKIKEKIIRYNARNAGELSQNLKQKELLAPHVLWKE